MALIDINGSTYQTNSIVEVTQVTSNFWDDQSRGPTEEYLKAKNDHREKQNRWFKIYEVYRDVRTAYRKVRFNRPFFGSPTPVKEDVIAAEKLRDELNEMIGDDKDFARCFGKLWVIGKDSNPFDDPLSRMMYCFGSDFTLRAVRPNFAVRMNALTEHVKGSLTHVGSMVDAGYSSSYGFLSSSYSSRKAYRPERTDIDVHHNHAKELVLEFDTHEQAQVERQRILDAWSAS